MNAIYKMMFNYLSKKYKLDVQTYLKVYTELKLLLEVYKNIPESEYIKEEIKKREIVLDYIDKSLPKPKRISEGETYVYEWESPSYSFFLNSQNQDRIIAISKSDNSQYYLDNVGYGGYLYKLKSNIEFTKKDFIDIERDRYKQQFLFNGKTGNSVKFSYREFSKDLARPAFTQDLQYDLAESNVIGFKGLRIEVIKATNTNITYKILKSFD